MLFTTNTFSQNTFRLWHFNPKEVAELTIGDLVTNHNQNAEFKSGRNQVERISFGDNKWIHRFVFFWQSW